MTILQGKIDAQQELVDKLKVSWAAAGGVQKRAEETIRLLTLEMNNLINAQAMADRAAAQRKKEQEDEEARIAAIVKVTGKLRDSTIQAGESFATALAPRLRVTVSIMGTELLPLLDAMTVHMDRTKESTKKHAKATTGTKDATQAAARAIRQFNRDLLVNTNIFRDLIIEQEKNSKQYKEAATVLLPSLVAQLKNVDDANLKVTSSVLLAIEAEEARQEALKETLRILEKISTAMVATTIGIVSAISTIWSNHFTKLEQQEDDRLRQLQEDLDAGLISEQEFLDGKKVIETEKRQLAHDAAIRQRDLALFGAIVSGAQAIVNGFASQPFLPVGLLMGALATVLTGIQIGAIASTPIPALAEGGIVNQPTVALLGEAGPEIVAPLDAMPMHVTVQLGSNVLFDEITQGTRDRNILIDKGAIA